MICGKKTVALCTSRVYDPNTHKLIETLNERLKTQDIRLFVYALNADIYWDENSIPAEADIFDYVPFDRVEAIILMDEKIKSKTVAGRIVSRAKKSGVPVIVIDGEYEGTINIGFDYAAGFEAAVRHVVEDHGIRDVHYMAGFKGNQFSEERKEVFKKVLAENKIPYNEETMVSYGEFWATPTRICTQKLIDENRLPKAIICANDVMAINAIDVIKKAGLSVPEDCIVTGFDGFDEVFVMTPAIATVTCDINRQAEATAKIVLSVLQGEKTDPEECRVLPVFIPNESCKCPRAADLANTVAMNRLNASFYRYQDDIGKIHYMIGRMMTAKDGEEAVSCIQRDFAKYMCCIAKSECLRTDKNFFLADLESEGYSVIYDSGYDGKQIQEFDVREIVPRLDEICAGGYPLIFQALDYMGKFIGYACYYYQTYEITEYAKTPSISEMIGAGFGGYLNMRCQKYLLAKVENMYKYDALTGLYNRLAFLTAFDALKNDPENKGVELTVLMSDLNHLKSINDNLGHDAGDRAIAAVATALKENSPENALCVRFGGDELIALIPGKCDIKGILSGISRDLEMATQENGFEISASIGYYQTAISSELNFEEAAKHADKSMYIEKEKSRAASAGAQ